MFFRQYKHAVGLSFTMTQCSNGRATMKCTKARIQERWEFVLIALGKPPYRFLQVVK